MAKRILITGGAGFIGSHTADLLLRRGYQVRALDDLSPQVHGGAERPAYLAPEVELQRGDIRDPDAVANALRDVDAVLHLAAAVGVGQSMYEISTYTAINELGTAVLLEALARQPVGRLVCASSMSVYGEGLARRPDGRTVDPPDRSLTQLRRGDWEVHDHDGAPLTPLPTPETKTPALSSVYALNKFAQERMCLIAGRAYAIPTIALRFFNVYGPRQALSNPYTGVLAIFASRLLNRRPPLVFEDGNQRRDFVHVHDVARACLLALEAEGNDGEVFNVGSGESRSVLEVARALMEAMGTPGPEPQILGRYRAGDIRHCFGDIDKIRRQLGFSPEVDPRVGFAELAEWLSEQVAEDAVELATAELERRGLVA
jgi:dTDP-L-rhamnose 4-epimerase